MSTSSTPTPPDSSRCPHCGGPLSGQESATCPHCGRLLPSAAASAAATRPKARPRPQPPARPTAPPPAPPVEAPPAGVELPSAMSDEAVQQANTGPAVNTASDPTALSATEKARLRTKVRIVVASFSAIILLLTYFVLLALRG